MGRKFLAYGFGVIALYLVVEHYTGASKVEAGAATGGSSLIAAFQGRK